jgi:hypothetical protein
MDMCMDQANVWLGNRIESEESCEYAYVTETQ